MNDRHEIAEQLRQLSRLYANTIKYRNKFGNMYAGKVPFILKDQDKWSDYFMEKVSDIGETEEEIMREIKLILKNHPWSKWLLSIKGIGARVAASIIGELDGAIYASIEKGKKITKSDLLGFGRKFESTADLWSFCGYGIKDGKAMKRKHGETAAWNNYLKATCFQFGEKQIMLRGDYRKYYDERKTFELATYPDLSKRHIEARARRYMIKKFISDIRYNLIIN